MKLQTLTKRLRGFGQVRNMTSHNGNDIPNQFLIQFDNGRLFKSYNSIIAIKYKGTTYLTNDWDYSQTTGKYRNMFLGETKKETEQKINSGVYKMLE
jgi:hypothetical protein